MSRSKVDIEHLSREERLVLLGEIWDSLAPEDVPLTDAQRAELDRRLDDLERERSPGMPWDDVRREIEERGR